MNRNNDSIFMKRALELATNGIFTVRPNPMVGAVIVLNNRIIGEGYHFKSGLPHAEINAINSAPKELLNKSTIYLTLEPCSHYGLTPPCAKMLVNKQFKRVVIGTIDSSLKVSGKGIEILKAGGCEVDLGVLEDECREINKRFFTFNELSRPHIILKWAQSADGFIDRGRKIGDAQGPNWITGEDELRLVHKWRAEEHSIAIGLNTLLIDNPKLTTRKVEGPNPLRILISDSTDLPSGLHILEDEYKTLVLSTKVFPLKKGNEHILMPSNESMISTLLSELVRRNIQSIIVEGGAKLLSQFIKANMWDEARIFYGNNKFGSGLIAPNIEGQTKKEIKFEKSRLVYLHPNSYFEAAHISLGSG